MSSLPPPPPLPRPTGAGQGGAAAGATAFDPVLQSLVRAVVDATGATVGWLLDVDGDALQVVAAAGTGGPELGLRVPSGSGSAGFVVASGQPLALAPRPGDARTSEGVAAVLGKAPASVLCVPCSTDTGVQGALEVIDKAGGAPFSFDDVEIATLLAGVAAAALSQRDRVVESVPRPEQLAAELASLAQRDPEEYGTIAVLVQALLSLG